MTEDMDVALAIARDADYWIVEIKSGSDISMLDEGRLAIAARHFNTLLQLLTPEHSPRAASTSRGGLMERTWRRANHAMLAASAICGE